MRSCEIWFRACGSSGDGRAVGLDDLAGPFQPCDSMILWLYVTGALGRTGGPGKQGSCSGGRLYCSHLQRPLPAPVLCDRRMCEGHRQQVEVWWPSRVKARQPCDATGSLSVVSHVPPFVSIHCSGTWAPTGSLGSSARPSAASVMKFPDI